MKYAVIVGYMFDGEAQEHLEGVYTNYLEAYGKAYLVLNDVIRDENAVDATISQPKELNSGEGYILRILNACDLDDYAKVFIRDDEDDAKRKSRWE